MGDKQRIFYVDALRAMAIVMLVMLHLPQYYPFKSSFYAPIIGVFDMALFFTISGYVTSVSRLRLLKRLRLLIPFFVIGIANTTVAGKSVSSFFTSLDKNGYWFLLVMSIFCSLLYAIKRMHVNIHVAFLAVEAVLVALFVFLPQSVNYLFCVNLAVLYWPFLWLGIVLQKRLPQVARFSPLLLLVTLLLGCAMVWNASVGGGYLWLLGV